MYQVPDTLADAVEQYRIDSLRTAMEKLHVGPKIFELLVTEDDSVTDDFGSLCDPIAYYADSSLSYMNLPPVLPSSGSVYLGELASAVQPLDYPAVPKALKQADSAAISKSPRSLHLVLRH